MSVIIFATSAAGKSHFTQRAFRHGMAVVDGDNVIASQKAWPKAKQWWKDPDAPKVHAKHAEIIGRLLSRNKDIVIAFNTHLAIAVPILRKLSPDTEIYAVDLPDARIRRNYALREASIKRGVSGHSSRPLEHYLRGAEKQRAEFRRLKIPTFGSFEKLADELGLYVRKTQKLY